MLGLGYNTINLCLINAKSAISQSHRGKMCLKFFAFSDLGVYRAIFTEERANHSLGL